MVHDVDQKHSPWADLAPAFEAAPPRFGRVDHIHAWEQQLTMCLTERLQANDIAALLDSAGICICGGHQETQPLAAEHEKNISAGSPATDVVCRC